MPWETYEGGDLLDLPHAMQTATILSASMKNGKLHCTSVYQVNGEQGNSEIREITNS